MDLVIRSYWKANGETRAVVRYPNTNYKNVEDMQRILKNRWKNKNVHWIKMIPNGIRYLQYSSLIAQEITLE